MSKELLKSLDMAQIAGYESNSNVVRYLRNRETANFSIGDILICQRSWNQYDEVGERKWTTEYTSETTKVPAKYIYVYENEIGIGYVKRLVANGKGLGHQLICLVEINHSNMRFIIDPDYQDSVLLGDDTYSYNNALKDAQKAKRAIDKKNKPLLVDTRTWESINAAFATLKPGDTVWDGWSSQEASKRAITVISIEKKSKHTYSANKHAPCLDFYAIELTHSGHPHKYKEETEHFVGRKLFLTQPFMYDLK